MNAKREIEIAKSVIINHLSSTVNIDTINAIYCIKNDDKEELLNHINALINIFMKAKEELEK